MKIKVRYFTTLCELARTREEEFQINEGSNLVNFLEKVSIKYGKEAFNYLHVKKSGKIDPSIQFLVNGVSLHNLHGFETELKEGDIIAIIPPIGGG